MTTDRAHFFMAQTRNEGLIMTLEGSFVGELCSHAKQKTC